jgi:hypothetical protein
LQSKLVTVVVSVTARENSASNACICSVCEHVLCSSVQGFVFLGNVCALFDGHRGSGSGTRNCKHVRTEKSCRRDTCHCVTASDVLFQVPFCRQINPVIQKAPAIAQFPEERFVAYLKGYLLVLCLPLHACESFCRSVFFQNCSSSWSQKTNTLFLATKMESRCCRE